MIKDYEKSLNDSFYENYNTDEIIDRFEYLTNPLRDKPLRRSSIVSHIANGTVGTMIRKHDPQLFYTGYHESSYYRK